MDYYASAVPDVAFTKRYDYDASNNMIYEGFAQASQNAATSDAAWCIKKYTYTGPNMTLEQWAGGAKDQINVWDNRASLTYK